MTADKGSEFVRVQTLAERLAAEAKDWDGVTLATLGQSESRRLHALLAEAAAALAAPPAESQPRPVQGEAVAWLITLRDGFRMMTAEPKDVWAWQADEGVTVTPLFTQPPAPAVDGCVCGDSSNTKVLHRNDGPCYTPAVQIAAPDHIADAGKMIAAYDPERMAKCGNTVAAPGDVEARALAILADALGRTLQQMGEPESDAYVTETAAFRAVVAALRSQGQAEAVCGNCNGSGVFDNLCGDRYPCICQSAALAQQAKKEQPPNT